ncbi:MAG: hypothetical protein ACRDY0_07620 [Acidimicrobiales bacterium]
MKTVYTLPPAGFDPLTASPAQLLEYAIPPRPSGQAALATWDSEMKGTKFIPRLQRLSRFR